AACRLGASMAGGMLRGCRPPDRSGSRREHFKKIPGRLRCVGWHVASRGGGLGRVGGTVGRGRRRRRGGSGRRGGRGGWAPSRRPVRSRGVGLGVVVGKQLSLPRRSRGIDGCARPCAAGLIEVASRVHDGGAGGGGFCIELFRESGCRFLSMDGGSDPLLSRSIVV
ncbi:MAG: hypothetical protein RL077_4532, partial [Verrucomicrobiota bacterium]